MGKTTPGLLNSKLDGPGISTVWILPLKSMHEQYQKRCREHGMRCETWTSLLSAQDFPQHILVTIETTENHSFHSFLAQLISNNRLARIIVDEAHLIFTHASFRSVMNSLQWLGHLPVQFCLMSATAGPSLVDPLFRNIGISNAVICREKTPRPNLSYSVYITDQPLENLRITYMMSALEHGDAKALIFCRTVADTKIVASALGMPSCDGSMTQENVDAVLNGLRSGRHRCIVSTSILGVALDLPDIRWVFHYGYPYDMVSFIQESGRAGRSPGSVGHSIVFAPSTMPPLKDPDHFGSRLIYDWANDRLRCRRWLMQLFNDGVGEPCSMMAGRTLLCDNCHVQSQSTPGRAEENICSLIDINPYIPRQ